MGKRVIHWIVYDMLDGLRYATKMFLVLVSFESDGKRSCERPITPSEKAVPECILSREETTRRKRLNLLLRCRSIVVTLTEKLNIAFYPSATGRLTNSPVGIFLTKNTSNL
jgi:hypothetical protein